MNIIELIKKLTNDISWKKIKEIGFLYNGLQGKKKEDFYNGNYKYITYMNVFKNLSVNLNEFSKVKINNNEKQNNIKYGDVIFTSSSESLEEIGISSVVNIELNENIYLNSFCFGLRMNDINMFNINFLKYLFLSKKMRQKIKKCSNGVTRINLSKKKFEEILIPIPPMEIQNKIVEILDKFTNYKVELTAELTFRKEQYKYYRNKLFSNLENVEYKLLGQVCEIKRGIRITKKDLIDNGEYLAISGGEKPFGKINKFNRNDNTITICQYGSAGYVNFQTEKFWANDVCYSLFPKLNILNNKFLYYYLINIQDYIYTLVTNAIPAHLPIERLNQLQIPIPPIEVQNKIVEILDKFSSLINNISEGLPKEIKLRDKQYNYYRDLLLDFEDK